MRGEVSGIGEGSDPVRTSVVLEGSDPALRCEVRGAEARCQETLAAEAAGGKAFAQPRIADFASL